MSHLGLTQQEFIRLFGEKNLITIKENDHKEQNIARIESVSPSNSEEVKQRGKQVKKNTKKVRQEAKPVITKTIESNASTSVRNNVNANANTIANANVITIANAKVNTKANTNHNINSSNNSKKQPLPPQLNSTIQKIEQHKINHKDETVKLINNIYNFISGNKYYNFNLVVNSEKDNCIQDLKNNLPEEIVMCVSPDLCIKHDYNNFFVLFDKTNYNDSVKQNLRKKLFKCVGSNVKNYNDDTDKMIYIPYKHNSDFIRNFNSINNFLLIKDYSIFHTKARFLLTVKNNDSDLIVIDPCFKKDHYFTEKDLNFIRYKNGNNLKQRMIYAYLNIKKIKKHDKYYNTVYCSTKEDSNEYVKVDYWKKEWFNSLCGHIDVSYLGFIIKTGYNGIFIDGCDY